MPAAAGGGLRALAATNASVVTITVLAVSPVTLLVAPLDFPAAELPASNAGIIAGAAVGGIVLLLALVVAVVTVRRRRRSRRRSQRLTAEPAEHKLPAVTPIVAPPVAGSNPVISGAVVGGGSRRGLATAATTSALRHTHLPTLPTVPTKRRPPPPPPPPVDSKPSAGPQKPPGVTPPLLPHDTATRLRQRAASIAVLTLKSRFSADPSPAKTRADTGGAADAGWAAPPMPARSARTLEPGAASTGQRPPRPKLEAGDDVLAVAPRRAAIQPSRRRLHTSALGPVTARADTEPSLPTARQR